MTGLQSALVLEDIKFAVPGGEFILRKVNWRKNNSLIALLNTIMKYVKNHHGRNVLVVFDPDATQKITKSAGSMCYLAMFKVDLRKHDVEVKQPIEDADVQILKRLVPKAPFLTISLL